MLFMPSVKSELKCYLPGCSRVLTVHLAYLVQIDPFILNMLKKIKKKSSK